MVISPDSLPRLTPEAYLAYEQDQPVRHELVDAHLNALTGSSDRHEEIALSLASALRVHLRGGPCRVYKGDLKVRVADDFYYPDVFVRCGAERGDPYFKTDPVLIAEILSPGTQRHDRGDKRLAFFTLPTLSEYVLIAQDRVRVEVFRRDAGDSPRVLATLDDVLRLESVNFAIALRDLYD
jgi:Uma2 family endonuclease